MTHNWLTMKSKIWGLVAMAMSVNEMFSSRTFEYQLKGQTRNAQEDQIFWTLETQIASVD